VSWDQRFAEPIVLPDGVKLASLREAIAYVVRTVPPSERSNADCTARSYRDQPSQMIAEVTPPGDTTTVWWAGSN
jgi:hypothetical protein